MARWRSLTTDREWFTVGDAPPLPDGRLSGPGPWERVEDDLPWPRVGLAEGAPAADRWTYAVGIGGAPPVFNLERVAGPAITASLSSRSSSKPQDPAYQIEESLESLDQELEDLVAAKEALSTQVEVLEEMCTAIRSHISTLRTVANQLRTSSPSPQSRQSKTEQSAGLDQPEAQPIDPFDGVAVGQAARRL